jgi:hypothetical protein
LAEVAKFPRGHAAASDQTADAHHDIHRVADGVGQAIVQRELRSSRCVTRAWLVSMRRDRGLV